MKISINSAEFGNIGCFLFVCLFVFMFLVCFCLVFVCLFVLTLTSLKRHCDVRCKAIDIMVSIERGDPYLSSSTKIIRIGGFIAKI